MDGSRKPRRCEALGMKKEEKDYGFNNSAKFNLISNWGFMFVYHHSYDRENATTPHGQLSLRGMFQIIRIEEDTLNPM